MIGKLLNLLFGKSNNIFDADGNVSHQLPVQQWDAWKKRYSTGAEYNWKNHSGRKARKKSDL